VGQKKQPPPFFLQDSSDGMCLGGEEFKRCAIDTLFYVVGSPGTYQIHKRPTPGAPDLQNCLARKTCNDAKTEPALLTTCTHCGAKKWNILGDATQGYVLSEDAGKICLFREKNGTKAMTGPCDSESSPYTPLQLQFATREDIDVMSSPGARLITAAGDGDKATVVELLTEGGVDVNVRDWDELTAVIPAASKGHLDVVKFLIEKGADVNLGDKDGITALMEAAIMGFVPVGEVLLEAGAQVDAAAGSGVTALWLAAGEGKIGILKLLLEKGADATIVRNDGITALMTASAGGHVDVVELLLENSADANAKDKDGLTALMNAAEAGNVPILKLLIGASGVDGVDVVSATGFTALIVAAAHGHTDAVSYLIDEAKAEVDKMHENGVTALMYAAAGGHVETTKALIARGGDVNMLHSNEGSALLESSTAGALEALKLLIAEGAKVDIRDKDGVTALMSAASQGHYDCVELLLDTLKGMKSESEFKTFLNLLSESGGSAVMFAAGVGKANVTTLLIENGGDVNAIAQATPEYLAILAEQIETNTLPEDHEPHIDGVTALHVAAQGGYLDCVNILIEAGAKVEVKDDEDRTALILAVKGNFGEVASALVKAGADPNTPYVDDEGDAHNLLMDAIIVENEEFASLLIRNGADLTHEDDHKVTTLLQASHRGMENIVELLLERFPKENIDKASDEGITPLIAAASEGHINIVKLLIEKVGEHLDVNAKDRDGTTAIMAAAARGHVNGVEILLKQGKADANIQNVDGHTALMFAYNGKNQVETLFERYNQFVTESSTTKKDDDKLDDGGTGPIIKEALANHTKLVSLLLEHGADESLKDKEGHTAKDFDFHPETDQEVLKKEEKKAQMRDDSKNEL